MGARGCEGDERGEGNDVPSAGLTRYRDDGGGFPWLLPAVLGVLIVTAAALPWRRQRLTAAANARTPGSIAGSAIRP